MKKVRYAVGAAGVVPVLGLMAPAVTAAAAPAQSAGKTVSLRHSGVSVAATGCTANTLATAKNISISLSFWHKYNPTYDTSCIGTVSMDFFGRVYNASSARLRIYARSLNGTKHLKNTYWAHNQSGHKFAIGVHKSFGYPPIQVCVAAVNRNLSSVTQGPLCKSVG